MMMRLVILAFLFATSAIGKTELLGCRVIGYDPGSRIVHVQEWLVHEGITFSTKSDPEQTDALYRVLQLWFMRDSISAENVVLFEWPEIRLMVEYDSHSRAEKEPRLPLEVALKELHVRLPIVLTAKEDSSFYILDDPAVAFAGVLTPKEIARFVTVDKAAIQKYRQKKESWATKGQDIYQFVTPEVLRRLAQNSRPNQSPLPTSTSVTPRAGARVAPAALVADL